MKPILFSTPMVQAILEGRKSQTRRVMKPQPLFYTGRRYVVPDDAPKKWHDCDDIFAAGFCPYGKPGTVLWVRETWTRYYYVDESGYTHYDKPTIYYAADGEPDIGTLYDADGFELDDQRVKWKPSIHMPKEAARLFLLVKDVRVERLQEITEEDAIAEGISKSETYFRGEPHKIKGTPKAYITAKGAFAGLWDSINGKKYPWSSNPWGWVISFERTERPVTP